MKTSFENKIKLLFDLTDIDEDGYLNRYEIENMITSINHLFGEEVSTINTHSSILSQSLTNIKINNIIYELIYGQGNLYNKFIEEKNYINFDTFYRGLKNIKNYKYRIIPCFINFRDCLFSQKSEKMINVKEKNKKDFINISSELILEQKKEIDYLINQKFSFNNLSEIIKPIKIGTCLSTFRKKKNIKLSYHSPEKFRKKTKTKNIYLKSDKSLKELMKTCTILNDEEKNDENKRVYNLKKNFKYAFQANFSDIRNLEVEPGVIKFLPNEIKDNNDNKINKMITKTPDVRKNYKAIINKFKKNQLFISLSKIIENNYEEEIHNRNEINLKKEKNSNLKRNKSDSSLIKYAISGNLRKLNKSTIKKTTKKFKNNYNSEKYKTLDEIIKEINTQQKKFNYDSINYINSEIIKKYKKMSSEMNKFRKNRPVLPRVPSREVEDAVPARGIFRK